MREPVQVVHNDYTDWSGPQRVRDLHTAAEAEDLLSRRVAVVQVWRAIRKLPEGAAVAAEPALAKAAGLPDAFLPAALHALDYRPDPASEGLWRKAAVAPRKRKPARPRPNPCSPFAKLRELTAGR